MARSWRSIRRRRRRGEVPGQGTATVSRESLRGTLTDEWIETESYPLGSSGRQTVGIAQPHRSSSSPAVSSPAVPSSPPYCPGNSSDNSSIWTGARDSHAAESSTEIRCGEGWAGRPTAALNGNPGPSKSRLSGCRGLLETAGVGHRGLARPGGNVRQKVLKRPRNSFLESFGGAGSFEAAGPRRQCFLTPPRRLTPKKQPRS